jgi:beta-galactosidase
VVQADGKSLSYVTVNVVDAHGVMVPDAANAISFSVTGAGTFVGADNGKEDDAEGYNSTTHTAFNGKVLAIVQSKDGQTGPITISATSPGLAPATTTIYSVGDKARGVVGIQPAYVRSPLGASPHLPSTATVVYADGSTAKAHVTWQTTGHLPLGVNTIRGTVSGAGNASAIVTVYTVGSVGTYSTVVPVGTPPGLPSTVSVVDTDGTIHPAPVMWAAVPPSAYAQEGAFNVTGTVAGTGLPALATVRVTSSFTPNQNIALSTSPTQPSADAGYSGAASTVPAGMLDGNTASGGWSNFYNKSATNVLPAVSVAHAAEWTSVSWPNAQRVSSVVPYFTISANRMLPSSVVVSYWNGTGWTPVANQQNTFATTTNQPSTITFDAVSTTRLRLDLTSPQPNTSTGFMQITELQVPADEVAYNTTAALSDLRVNGQTVPGFDGGTTTYTVAASSTPTIAATAADNGRVVIIEPQSVPGVATIAVTSEDGRTSTTYTINVNRSHHGK